MNKYTLSEEQKLQVIEEFKKDPDLKRITQVISGDPEADGRHKIGRAIRAFLSEQNKEYRTTKAEEVKAIEITDSAGGQGSLQPLQVVGTAADRAPRSKARCQGRPVWPPV